ncbi:MAG: aminopeptidase, partial [Anaerolineales bacterium]
MEDPRVDRLAGLLVEHSTQVGPGHRVVIEAEPPAEPLVKALARRILRAGGHPHPLINLPGLDAMYLAEANPDQLDFIPTFQRMAYETFEARIRIQSSSNTKALSQVDEGRMARRNKAMQPILQAQMERGARQELRWVTTLFPTEAYAQDAEMSLAEYEDLFYRACQVHDGASDPAAVWREIKVRQTRIIEAIEGHDRLAVRGPSCDLSLSIRGRKFKNSHGLHNMPDGEIYTAPVEDSVDGWVRFSYPAIWQGREVEGVELRFEDGKVVQATARKNEAFLLKMLDSDEGARRLGEFAVGTNP